MIVSTILYWILKIFFSFLFVIYFATKFGAGDPGIWWDVIGVASLLFFAVNIIWVVRR